RIEHAPQRLRIVARIEAHLERCGLPHHARTIEPDRAKVLVHERIPRAADLELRILDGVARVDPEREELDALDLRAFLENCLALAQSGRERGRRVKRRRAVLDLAAGFERDRAPILVREVWNTVRSAELFEPEPHRGPARDPQGHADRLRPTRDAIDRDELDLGSDEPTRVWREQTTQRRPGHTRAAR